jgi:hypothetical protein
MFTSRCAAPMCVSSSFSNSSTGNTNEQNGQPTPTTCGSSRARRTMVLGASETRFPGADRQSLPYGSSSGP